MRRSPTSFFFVMSLATALLLPAWLFAQETPAPPAADPAKPAADAATDAAPAAATGEDPQQAYEGVGGLEVRS